MTSPVFETLATELRIIARILVETVGGIRRTGWMNLVIVITMASILSIFGTVFAFVTEIDLFAKNIGAGLKISAYLKEDVDIETVLTHVKALPDVERVEIYPRDKAWDDMRANYQVPEDLPNPLPDTLHIKMVQPQSIQPTVEKLQTLEGIEKVSYAQSLLEKLEKVANITSWVGLVVSIFLGVLTMFIISNTIHLLIEARSREIEILRMMGVGNWYIRLPFLFQGGLYGLLGTLIAYIPLNISEYYLSELFEYFQFSTSHYSLSFVSMILILMGIFVGAGGATFATHKYLKI